MRPWGGVTLGHGSDLLGSFDQEAGVWCDQVEGGRKVCGRQGSSSSGGW